MTPGARLHATVELLTEIATIPRPADAVVSGFFRARRYIGSKDRGAVAELAYAVLRRHARLGWWIDKNGGDSTSPRERLIANLILGDGRRALWLEKLFDGAPYAPPPFTPSEVLLARSFDQRPLEHPKMPEAVRAECPSWAEPQLRAALGERFLTELEALREPAPLDVRANPVRTDRDGLLGRFKALGLTVAPCKWSPVGIRLTGRPALSTLDLFQNGSFEIQDEGSQLVALLVDARPGQQVVDFCAGAGGKSLAIAAAMQNKGRVIACDVLEGRLKRAAERLRRAGLHNVETRPLGSERDPWVKRHKGMYDRVLVDVPCSGTGTWRRNPDARWRPLGPGLSELVPLQASILDSAARLVKPGGRLIYATCSLLQEENEHQIEAFLAARNDFRPLPLQEIWPLTVGGPCPCEGPWLRLTPALHATDGFFAAVLVRTAAEKAPTASDCC